MMGPKLQGLLALQDLELQIMDIRAQTGRKERQAAGQLAKLKTAEAAAEAKREEIRRTQMEFDRLDLDIKTRTTRVDRLREQLNAVKTNKEYAVILSEMNNDRADLNKIETAALERMGAIDTMKEELAALELVCDGERSRLKELETIFEETRATYSDRLTRLEKQRDELMVDQDEKTRAMFARLSERYDGEVMARVVRTHPRRDDFLCEGCNMTIVTDRASALMSRDEVLTCRNCGRILYIETSS